MRNANYYDLDYKMNLHLEKKLIVFTEFFIKFHTST